MTSRFRILILVAALISAAACSRAPRPLLQDLSGKTDDSKWTLLSATGTRDADRLDAHIVIAGAGGTISLDLHFLIGNPVNLTTGMWRGENGQDGRVTSQSVVFLGGQSGPPSLGGTYDLHQGMGGAAVYRLNLPNTELKRP